MVADPSMPPAGPQAGRPSFTERHLDHNEIVGELLFGVIMALSFTLGAGLVVQDGPEATRAILLGLLGCNIAWGLIDGGMYVMNSVLERTRKQNLVRAIQSAPDESALALIEEELGDSLQAITSPTGRRDLFRRTLTHLRSTTAPQSRIRKQDLLAALAVFWLVARSAVLAILPFLVLRDRFTALRVSNLLLLGMLFVAGFRWAKATHGNPWRVGSLLVLIGLGLVAIAIALGG